MKKTTKGVRKLAIMPRQSWLPLGLITTIQARYASFVAILLVMLSQTVGVYVFTQTANAVTGVVVETFPASSETKTSAVLNGVTNDGANTSAANYSFEFGSTTGYGSEIAAQLTGELIFKSQFGSFGFGPGQFGYAAAIELGQLDVVYVLDGGSSRVQKFTTAGAYLSQWGSPGSGDGQFSNATDMAIDTLGNVYVVDRNNYRIQKFDADGNYISQWGSQGAADGQFSGAYGLAIDATNNIYVSDSSLGRIQKFDADGNYISQWGSIGTGDGQFNYPAKIAIDTSGMIYIADAGNYRIQKFDADGNYISQWGSQGAADGQFQSPLDGGAGPAPFELAIDSADQVYVLDNFAGTIQKFNSNGAFVQKFDLYDVENYQFIYATGIALSPGGDLYTGLAKTNSESDPPQVSIQEFKGHITANANELVCGSTYHYRVKAQAGLNITYGDDKVFTTGPCDGISFLTSDLKPGTVSSSYEDKITTDTAGATLYLEEGELPPGLELASDGVISGTPQEAGDFSFTVLAEYGQSTGSEQYSITVSEGQMALDVSAPEVLQVAVQQKSQASRLVSSPAPTIVPNDLFARIRRLPTPLLVSFPYVLLLMALILVGSQYLQVSSEHNSIKRMQHRVTEQERLVDEQNNFIALTTHYIHTPLTVMEGEISLMVKAGTITEAEAAKLRATLTDLSAQADSVLAQEDQNKVE